MKSHTLKDGTTFTNINISNYMKGHSTKWGKQKKGFYHNLYIKIIFQNHHNLQSLVNIKSMVVWLYNWVMYTLVEYAYTELEYPYRRMYNTTASLLCSRGQAYWLSSSDSLECSQHLFSSGNFVIHFAVQD
jgi:hypothetical protein